ncbi:MAG: type III secretion system export apparatus subunit SctV [Bilophila wadsworthia]
MALTQEQRNTLSILGYLYYRMGRLDNAATVFAALDKLAPEGMDAISRRAAATLAAIETDRGNAEKPSSCCTGHGRQTSPPAMPACTCSARAWQQGRKDEARAAVNEYLYLRQRPSAQALAEPPQQHGQTRMSLFTTARSAVGVVTRHNDINIVFLLVTVIALMIIPLPTPVVDTLIGVNMALSFTILMMTMYVRTVLDFSVFPTLLLFTTLFRVGLNITTTRLILLQADAGEIIFTFGEFALGGNFVVGAVVFLILTIVQFLVIAKGAERVAEVGARFTLDAMPGKQMSIDADMRAGVIDMEEAQRRRERISQESQMYGAMDGAMKFVKGDSIAGMIIAVVNIVGGTIIGITQNGMTAGDALHTYGILTIGDGLVSQIPSLLISISAGILITRTGDSDDNVGSQIGLQIFAQPKALLMAGGLVFLFALIPGFPKPQLFTLAALLGGLGYVLKRVNETPQAPDAKEELSVAHAHGPPQVPPRRGAGRVRAHRAHHPRYLGGHGAPDYASLNEELANLRRALYFDLGVPFPGINIRPNPGLPELSYVLNVNEIPMSRGKLEKGMVLARDTSENLSMLGVEFKLGERFLPDVEPLWVPESKAASLERVGISIMNHARILAYHLSLLLARHASSFLGMQESKYLLDKMEERAPDLVREATRLLPTQRIAEIFQRLVQEQISIRDLRSILEALIEWSPKEKDTVMLTEYVRSALKRQISYMYSKGQNMLPAILLDPSVEETIRKAIRQTSAGAFLALDPDTTQRFLRAVTESAGKYTANTQKPVLMASMDIRRYVRRLIEGEHYGLPVVSYQEVTPEISIQPVSRIRL